MESSFDQVRVFLSMLVVHVPTLIVCAIALVVIMGRRQEGSSPSFWAITGFGAALALCFVIPAMQTALQQWVFAGGGRMGRAWVFTPFGFAVSALHAGIYGCLLMAIIDDRRAER